MKRTLSVLLVLVLIGAAWRLAFAQGTVPPWQVTVNGLHTACTVPAASNPPSATFCFATDGLWQSLNGGAYTQLGAGTVSAGVTSFNGRTGAVIPVASDYPPVVSSVNGKIGAVVLQVNSSIQ